MWVNWVALRSRSPAGRQACTSRRTRKVDARTVMTQGWNEKRQAFTHEEHERHNKERSVQFLASVKLARTDPRMLRTIKAILESPRHGGLVMTAWCIAIRRNPALTVCRARKGLSTCALFGS